MKVKREIVVAKESFISNSKHVFMWDGKIYRGYDNIDAPGIRKFMLNLDKLYNMGLARTSIAPLVSKEFSLILEHDVVDFVTYREEWTSKMLLDAGIMMLDLQAELVQNEMCLYDGHASNVLYDYTRPVFIDFDSIVPLSASIAWFDGFYPQFAKTLAQRSNQDPTYWFELGNETISLQKAQVSISAWQDAFLEFLAKVRDWFSNMSVNAKVTPWSNYPQPTSELTNNKQKVVGQLLDKIYSSGMTLFDIGSNEGWYSNFAHSKGYKVVAVDIDEQCVTRLYLQAKLERRKVLPLVFNVLRPWYAHPPYINAIDRLKCDVALGLAVVHHMVFSQKATFPEIASRFNDFARKYCIVEFPPEDDIFVHRWVTPETSWYNLNNFIVEMSAYFPKFEVFDSHPSPRKMILFEK